jgi:acetyl coenzyme A synthetase (ADP forming)-like protein
MFLTEPEVFELLAKHGISTLQFKVFRREEFPGWQKFPAVVKVVSRKIIHKSNSGGIVFVNSKKELIEKVKELQERFPEVDQFIIEEKLSGIEAFVGVRRDPSFSHVIGVGSGGILVELFQDVVFIPISADEKEINTRLKETKLYRLIEGFRNYKGNLELFIDFLKKLQHFLRKNPEIYEMDLNPVFITKEKVIPADGRAIIKEPEKKKEFKRLEENLFRPRTIAIIGATLHPRKVGYALLRNLERFKGSIFPVNPKHEKILGKKCYKSVVEIPEPIDCAIVAVPAKVVPDVVRECGKKGVKLVVIISAGFSETGEKGRKLQEEIVRIAAEYKMRVLGPNTLGFLVPSLKLNASFSSLIPPAGNISFLSQSGALITAVIDRAVEEGIGFSEIISFGNQSDIEITEAFELATRNNETKVILSYVEGLKLGDTLLEFLKKKPSIFLKAGRGEEGKRAASSHTGSLAGNFKIFKDAVETKGGIVVDTIEEAFDCCQFLSVYGRVKGNRILIITNAGGPGALASDYVSTSGLKLADIESAKEELSRFLPPNWSRINPVDLVGDATSDRYRKAFDVLSKCKNWDSAIIIVTPQSMTDIPEISHEIIRFREISDKPVIGCFMGGHTVKVGVEILRREEIPVYSDPYRAVNVLRRILNGKG